MNATAKQQPSYLGQDINDGSLRIINCVGSGSYGAVYLAHVLDSAGVDTGRELAIKVIPKPTATSHHGRSRARRIHREIMLHQRVRNHPNVTTIRDVFQDAHSVFLTLDYHSGGDLYDFLEEANTIRRLRATDRPAAAELVRNIFVQVVNAVMHCHAHGVFHRDIKPENVLVGADGKVHLADFGLATMQALCTELGCGSPFFMAPEVFIQPGNEKRPYSARHADIWSLGVLLANLLTTSRPWEFAGPDDGDYYEYLGTLPAADVVLHMNVRVIPPEDPELAASRVGALRGLSAEATELLRGMFQLEPRKRMPLAEVRRRVLDVRAWWKEDEEQIAEIDAEMERMVDFLVDDDDMPGPPQTEFGEGVGAEADVDKHPDVPRSPSPTSPVHDPTPIPAHLVVTVRHRVYYSHNGSSSSMAYETVFEDHAPNADRVGLYVVNGSVSSDSDEEWEVRCDYDSDEEDLWREGPNDVIVLDQSVFEEAASSESDDNSATHTPATLPVDVEGTIASVPAMDLESWDDQTTDFAVDKNCTEHGPVRMVGADGRSIDVALV